MCGHDEQPDGNGCWERLCLQFLSSHCQARGEMDEGNEQGTKEEATGGEGARGGEWLPCLICGNCTSVGGTAGVRPEGGVSGYSRFDRVDGCRDVGEGQREGSCHSCLHRIS